MRRVALSLAVVAAGCGFHAGGGTASSDANSDDDASVPLVDAERPVDGSRTDWYDARYLHRRLLTVATKELTGNVTGFPVLVTLPTSVGVDLAAGASDLRFVSMDNMDVYPYELDTFNAAGNTTAWVRLTLTNNNPTWTFWVYYGYPNATGTSNGATVFEDFESVHHLGGLGDSTSHNHNASATTAPNGIAGQVGGAQNFDGTDDYLEMANSGDMDFGTTMSVSAWFKVTQFDRVYQCIVCKGDNAWRIARADETSGVGFGTTSGGPGMNDNVNGDVSVNNGQWHHIVGVMNGTKKVLYVDGEIDLDAAYTKQLDNTPTAVRIGMNVDSTSGGTRNWSGVLDEVRVTGDALSSEWVKAEYTTVHDATFVRVGADERYQ